MKPRFPHRNLKNSTFWIFPVEFFDGEASFSSGNFFSQAEISYESKGVLFDQMKVSDRRREPKILKSGNFHNQ